MKVQTTGRILLHSVFRRQRVILSLFLTIMGTILLGSLLWPPSYEAAASVIIRARDYQDVIFPQARAREYTVLVNPKEEINTEIEIMQSYPVLKRTVEALHLHKPLELKDEGFWGSLRQVARAGVRMVRRVLTSVGLLRELPEPEAIDAAVARLHRKLIIEPTSESQIIKIYYRAPDPYLAAQVVNTVTEEYLKQHLDINLNRSENTFFEEQVKKVEDDLYTLHGELAKLKSEHGIISFTEQTKALIQKLESFEVARDTAQKEIISKRSKVERIRELRRTNPSLLIPLPEIAHEAQISDLENKLVTLRYQLATLLQRYTPESRQVIAARGQIAQVDRQIRTQVSNMLEREIAELRKLQAEDEALAQTVQSLKSEVTHLSSIEPALMTLEKQISDRETTLTAVRKKHQESVVARATDFRLGNAKVVSPASLPLEPAAPNLPLNLGLGFLLAALTSFSAALLVEYWDDSLKIPEDVERVLGRSLFGSISEL